jgi:hypothetical protein
MKSTGRFTPALRHLVYHSYDECRRCGAKISKPAAALAGYDAAGRSAYVGECCKGTLKELASHIYWSWHADRRCAPEQKLWRYMDLAKFLSLLEDRALYFARADKLGDPFEGAAGIAERQSVWDEHYKAYFRHAMITIPGQTIPPSEDQLEKDSVRLLGEMRQAMEHDRHRTFANCWHANSVESEALWRLYCPPPHPGVMIQTTAEALEASLGPDVDVEIAHVQYLDFKTAFAGPYERILTKRKSLSHETEVRAVFRHRLVTDPPAGLMMPVDLRKLVHAIVPSPFSPPWLLSLLARTLKRYDLDLPIGESELLAEPFF